MKCIPHSLLVAILTAFAVLFALPAKAATPSLGQPITIGQRHQIQSAALLAPVSYLGHTPKLYERTDQAYPVTGFELTGAKWVLSSSLGFPVGGPCQATTAPT
jgi:hypothetical protein